MKRDRQLLRCQRKRQGAEDRGLACTILAEQDDPLAVLVLRYGNGHVQRFDAAHSMNGEVPHIRDLLSIGTSGLRNREQDRRPVEIDLDIAPREPSGRTFLCLLEDRIACAAG